MKPSAVIIVPVALIAALLAGCGSGAGSRTSAGRTNTTTSAAAPAATAATTAATAKTGTSLSATAPLAPAACAQTVAATIGTVAERVYHEAATGGDVAQAVHRVQSSSALAAAAQSGDAAAAHVALAELLLGQIVRIEVLRDGHVLAQAGSGAAIAPVRGAIPGTGATFVLSTQASHSYVEVVRQVTGATVELSSSPAGGTRAAAAGAGPSAAGAGAAGTGAGAAGTGAGAAGTDNPAGSSASPNSGAGSPSGSTGEAPGARAPAGYRTYTLTGLAYPQRALRVVLLVPTAGVRCPGSAAQARVETLGKVGELIYAEELHSPDVARTVRHIEASKAFQEALATRDPAAARAAIVGFFREHIHVVRVRASTGAGLLVDVGGPYVLAPVDGVVRRNGKTVGSFEMAIQDDAGYLKLAHLFTGAQVLMREGSHQAMGTLTPGPASVPDRGAVTYDGHAYAAYSFDGTAFPAGPLRISLLVPVS